MTFRTRYRIPPLVREVDAEPIYVDGLPCAIYAEPIEGEPYWHVCEFTTGLSIGNHGQREMAIRRAQAFILDNGLAKVRSMAREHERINSDVVLILEKVPA